MRKPLVPRAGDPGSSSRTTVAIRSSTWSRAITVAAAVTINQSAARSSSSELERFLVPPLMMRACVSAARRRPSAPQKRVASGDRWRELPQTPIVRGENSLPWIIAAVPRSARAGSFAAAAVIRRITRRHDVSDGAPASSTASMTCAVPATFGTTSVRGAASDLTIARGAGSGGPSTAEGMPPSFWLPPPPIGPGPAATTGWPGMPVPASA